VLDRAFARRYRLAPGDWLRLQGVPFRVTGISRGTNAVITQLAFVSLGDARGLLGLGDVVSFLLVTGRPGVAPESLVAAVRRTGRRLNAFTQPEFARNNLDELRNGLLPVLATVDAFGAAVGAAVLGLLLYGTVVERREDFALLKALGAGRGALRRLVLRQAAFAVGAGFAAGLGAHLALAPLLGALLPQVPLALDPAAAALALALALAMGLAGAWLPIARLERVYPAEVFRA
jgi:putative ABC transport system permease protein